jgi:phenylpropionate dioxygenase-like ring-hydroxylating dioxygenase large terminal subunit
MLDALPPLITPDWRLLDTSQGEVAANWKILVEGFIEGYHIRSTHAQTFYLVQYDNVNVVETFGRNSRVTYPYRAIEKLRTVPAAERNVEGRLTYVYHLFPNVMLATFPMNLFLVVLEPLTIDRTLLLTYTLGKGDAPAGGARSPTGRGPELIDSGAAEDRAVACSIQRSLASGANEFFEFGRCEGAIGHFHRSLDAALAAPR